ncbi:MAG TPA: hypothetical protein VNA69_10765 [Thermoanaerobaculia bacterium]|nr:hypothetical protein [Thermoanaerobaculia bacterium]
MNPILSAARTMLLKIDPSPFSTKALETFILHVEQYIDDLVLESVWTMQRHHAEQVTPSYVEMAGKHLIARRRNRVQVLMERLGGGLVGAGGTMLLQMWLGDGKDVTFDYAFTCIALIVCGMLAIGFKRSSMD